MTELQINYHLLQKRGTDSLEAILEKLLEQGETELYIISVFMTKGFEYSKMKARVLAYKNKFNKVSFSSPVLMGRRRIKSFAAFLVNEYNLNTSSNYIFVGHGLPDSKNKEYFLLDKDFQKLGYKNARVSLLMGKTPFDPESFTENQVTIIPILISCGKHIKQDIFGESDSFCSKLENKGIKVEKQIISLDMSNRFNTEFLR